MNEGKRIRWVWRALLSIGVLGLLLIGASLAADEHEGPLVELEPGEDYGAGIRLRVLTPLDALVADPARFEGRDVLIRGRISDVCQRKGCWTVLSSDESHVRVDFEDYAFVVPSSSGGRQAYAEGRVKVAVVSDRDARHFAGESAHPEAARLHRSGRSVGLTARGLRILESK